VFLFYPRFYHKAFSVGVGIMLAARYWNIFSDTMVYKPRQENKSLEMQA
jgi:hypothetical protein